MGDCLSAVKTKRKVYKAGKPGWAFKSGKLYRFEGRKAVVMAPWPDPRAWIKTSGAGFRATRKHADEYFSKHLFPKSETPKPIPRLEPVIAPSGQCLLFPVDEYDSHLDQIWRHVMRIEAGYFDLIPDEVREELLKYGDRKWHLFSLFARCPGALDLSRSNPGLCYALASNWVFRKPAPTKPIRAARALVFKKQKLILDWLGFPGTEPVRRILAKITPNDVSIPSLLYLRDALREPDAVKHLSRVWRITAPVMRLVSDSNFRPRLTPRLLSEAAEIDGSSAPGKSLTHFLKDLIMMADQVEWRGCPPLFNSLKHMREVHDGLMRRVPSKPIGGYDWFPGPPFPGTRNIRPLETAAELYREGREMKHCVGAYSSLVEKGKCYVYRVLEPVRATLSIIPLSEGRWGPHQLYGPRNQPVDEGLAKELFKKVLTSSRS